MNSAILPLVEQIDRVLLGKQQQIKLSLCCLMAGGHLLIEDVPGVGKTTLANSLAHSLGLSYQRVQFTSDMLPADLLGVSIFNQDSHEFTFHKGPVFSQVVLGDEINRASPKTQSALLEAMAEGQVSIDGETYTLPQPFFVIATQNPLEHSGTFELPDSQLDRFLMRVTLGYPSADAEKAMLNQVEQPTIAKVINSEQLSELKQQVNQVTAADAVLDYILRLVNETRSNSHYAHPLSPRASRALLAASKAWAFIEGRDYVLPEDVQAVIPAVCEHRLRGASSPQAQSLSEQLLHSVNPLG
ncbi:MoxR family ATPase [Psychrobium sp. MM17-31]|uniref:AAA family ATPase n=1 Tax=Psychrobium sp. MM17-31 TaxID=2917758 RepID=UPI001EF66A66|nr:MoxR family ATPase [Psychrobium sp. MM17-31]MCG7532939.1 MoxR family ATPase [Psychrobium sp. MM17-31]